MTKKWRKCNDGAIELSDGTGNGYCVVIEKSRKIWRLSFMLGINTLASGFEATEEKAKKRGEKWIEEMTS